MTYDKSTPLLPDEEFRPHPVWLFDVSTLGRVRNQKTGKFVGSMSGPQGGRPGGRNRYLRTRVSSTPGVWKPIHILILETFIGPRPEGHDGDHRNHDSMDNRLSNLRWRPSSENRADVTR